MTAISTINLVRMIQISPGVGKNDSTSESLRKSALQPIMSGWLKKVYELPARRSTSIRCFLLCSRCGCILQKVGVGVPEAKKFFSIVFVSMV